MSTRRFVLFQSPSVYIDLSFSFRDSPVSVVQFWDLYSFCSSSVLVTSRFWEGSLFVYMFWVLSPVYIIIFLLLFNFYPQTHYLLFRVTGWLTYWWVIVGAIMT